MHIGQLVAASLAPESTIVHPSGFVPPRGETGIHQRLGILTTSEISSVDFGKTTNPGVSVKTVASYEYHCDGKSHSFVADDTAISFVIQSTEFSWFGPSVIVARPQGLCQLPLLGYN